MTRIGIQFFSRETHRVCSRRSAACVARALIFGSLMRLARTFVPCVALAVFASFAGNAHAQEASPTAKGVIGGALLGGEAVLVIQAAFGVQSPWAYLGGGLAGGVAGGVGGYFIERDSSARVPMLMLAAGMALAIPTTVAVLSATAYEPPLSYVQDTPPADEPVADPPRPTSKRDERQRAHSLTPPALIDFEPRRITLSVPSVALYDVYTQKEVATLGVRQATELRIPVLNVLF